MDIEKTLIIVPVYNEWPHVMSVLERLKERFPNVLVVEDGSRRRISRNALKSAGIRYMCLPFNLGAWAAIETGFKYALLKDYQYAVTFDGDGQHLPEEIPRLLDGFTSGCDIVIGSCPERVSTLRRACWAILRKLSGLQVSDVTSGFRAYNRKAFKGLSEFTEANIEYQDLGVLLLAGRLGLTVTEVCTRMQCRIGGKSRIFPNMASIAKYFLITLVSVLVKWK